MQEQPNFEQVVDTLLRPKRPAPAAFVRVLVIHGSVAPAFALDENEAQIVHEQLAVSNDDRLDMGKIPDFDMLIADVTDDAKVPATAFRFLIVRRPVVFVLMNQYGDLEFKENISAKAEDMGYRVSFEHPTGSLAMLTIGTLAGVSPRWVPTELLENADRSPFEFDAAWVINEEVKLARRAMG